MLQKRVAAIHDISGFGKCSLTVALPIISAAGIETSVIPTAVLSTHTGGIEGFIYHDLTENILPFAKHWHSLNLSFDSIYTGFLGSYEQIDIVSNVIDIIKNDKTFIMVDPCMADNGEMYKIYTPTMAEGIKKLCCKADIIVPNLTEATMMLSKEYKKGPYTKQYIKDILLSLCDLGCKKVVLTGVYFEDGFLGCACYDNETNHFDYYFNLKIPGDYHGTGDVFASALLSGILNGLSLFEAMKLSVDFTCGSILRTQKAGTDKRFGVNFEQELPDFIKSLKLI